MTHWKTLDAAERAFRRAWRRADEAGREGSRVREGLVAAFAVAAALEDPEGPPVEEVFAALEGRGAAESVGVPELRKGDRVEVLPGATRYFAGYGRGSVPESHVGAEGEVVNPCDEDGDVAIRLAGGRGWAYADPAHVRRVP